MSILILIQTVCHSDSVLEQFFENVKKKLVDVNKIMKYYPACKELKDVIENDKVLSNFLKARFSVKK